MFYGHFCAQCRLNGPSDLQRGVEGRIPTYPGHHLLKLAGIEPLHLVKIYTTIIRSVIEYAFQVWHTTLTTRQTNQIENIQKRAMHIIFCGIRYEDAIATTRIPTPVILNLNSTGVHKNDYTKYVNVLRTPTKSYELAIAKSRGSQKHQKGNYVLRIHGAVVQPGDRVLMRIVAFDGKHKNRQEGK